MATLLFTVSVTVAKLQDRQGLFWLFQSKPFMYKQNIEPLEGGSKT
jgi:hypothetical protein